MDQENQAARTLSDRLRDASIVRASRRGDVVDDRMLDPTGVIDLRDAWAEPAPPGLAAALEAAASDLTLYHRVSPANRPGRPAPEPRADRTPDPDPRPDLPTRTPAASAFEAPKTNTSPALSQAFLSIEVDSFREAHGDDAVAREYPVVGDDHRARARVAPSTSPDDAIDLRAPTRGDRAEDGDRPVATCPGCGGLGRRDLFDRFSQTDYFSCDDCSAMWQVSRD